MTKTQLDEFEALLEETLSKTYTVADIVEGTILKKENGGYLVSVKGAKTEAFLPEKEISNNADETENLQIGDVREFYVLKEENDDEVEEFAMWESKSFYHIKTSKNREVSLKSAHFSY